MTDERIFVRYLFLRQKQWSLILARREAERAASQSLIYAAMQSSLGGIDMLKTRISIIGIALLIGGCVPHLHSLKPGASSSLLAGEFHHGPPNRLVLRTAERRYVAEGFTVKRHMNWNELRKTYQGSDPKHWDRIVAGHDKDHETLSAEVTARAEDGTTLGCRFAWPAGSVPRGVCQDSSGTEMQVSFE